MSDALQTALYAEHRALQGRMVEFAGYSMPVQYKATGLVREHHAVRQAAGLFDVSHMGQLEFRGPDAAGMVNRLITNDLATLANGRAQYTCICNDEGTILDDAISYKLADDHVMMVVNASNRAKIVAWFHERATGDATFRDVSEEWALLALQGPLAPAIGEVLLPGAADMGPFEARRFGEVLAATTGYTGERGFELFAPVGDARRLWRELLLAGTVSGIVPVGLGARDTLRLEMKYCLYGNDIDETTNPLEAGLGWVTKLDKPGGFIGRDALAAIKKAGTTRRLVGLRMLERGIARHGYPVLATGAGEVGTITSGTMSPSLGEAIALAYVQKPHHKIGTKLRVQIRQRQVLAEIVGTPFYKKSSE